MERKEKYKSLLLYLIISALVVALAVAFIKIAELNNMLANLTANHDSDIGTMFSNIEDIYDNVDQELKKQASILTGYDITYGPLDTSNYTTPLLFTVTPKAVSDDTSVSVTIGDTSVKLNRDGESFSGYIDTNVFLESSAVPLISVKSNGATKNEYLEEEDLSGLFTRYIPYLYSYMTVNEEKFLNEKIKITGDISVECKPSSSEDNTTFTRYFMSAEADGKELFRKDITKKVEAANGGMIAIDETISASEHTNIEYYITATDSLGLTHKSNIHCTYLGGNDTPTETVVRPEGRRFIYDKNGKLLYGNE